MKLFLLFLAPALVLSLPTRERELKHDALARGRLGRLSLPTRERELKRLADTWGEVRAGRSLHGSVN